MTAAVVPAMEIGSLVDRVAIVTGVNRRAGIVAQLGGEGDRPRHVAADFADPQAPAQVVAAAVAAFNVPSA
ncbi:hypothetical protein [Amycolatopsis sp.]|uniref:hypothetical protein n=1 Tax=Amycolatopsis sp. TaxID=37632 RepID=UPI002D8066CD|nr:hypothetical protein [Amycolatopsis sp.]HET6706763.1 hypothetical protein [Amycolatopsis sp.]